MTVENVTTTSLTTTSALTTGTTVATDETSLDSDDFLTLLVTQLTNQDPSNPMDTGEMVAQQIAMAQMEAVVTQTETIQEQFALTMRMAAADLVGKEVSYYDSEGDIVTGEATGASYADSVPVISVDGVEVTLDEILSVDAAASTADSTDTESTDSSTDTTDA
ncbi:flagellar hook capping FlgD N-terminal domain-containing protein [Demequina sp. NBRC 110054]|uniref:flagellar hook capping FlgD N-terminal domain-containing protein n=1 Tax=Demequina sp. NBRC 110054 TaxID=1570343 RepID=UPI0009FF7073|nr:flagellar hook capping FlgD N-terminal domain-containing protein [Demequina sp. NBRC 110054]